MEGGGEVLTTVRGWARGGAQKETHGRDAREDFDLNVKQPPSSRRNLPPGETESEVVKTAVCECRSGRGREKWP